MASILTLGTMLIPVAILATIVYSIIVYHLDQYNLKRFPGPTLAAYSPLWLMYHNWRGHQYKVIAATHQKHGPVVRISHRHLSFSDPSALKDIYSFNRPVLKDEMYAHLGGAIPSMSTSTVRENHAAKRRSLSHVFSAKQITAMEPRVQTATFNLVSALRKKAEGDRVGEADLYVVDKDGAFDVRPWLNFFTYDAITAMFFTNSYGFLEKGDDLCLARKENGTTFMVHAMVSYQDGLAFNTLVAFLPKFWNDIVRKVLRSSHGARSLADFASMARHQVYQRLHSPPPDDKPDLFTSLPTNPTPKHPFPMPFAELVSECATMIDAGNDTTQTTLTNCVYHLGRYPDVQTKLRRVLLDALNVTPDQPRPIIASYRELQHIAYLKAVLDENFRCRPALARGLPRRVMASQMDIPAGNQKVAVLEGTTVSVPLWVVHHDSSLFGRANEFIPERWLGQNDSQLDVNGYRASDQEKENLKEFVAPFSLGPRACIGRNLAYMEVSIVVSALVLAFRWELAQGEELLTVERFNCNVKELFVRLTPIT